MMSHGEGPGQRVEKQKERSVRAIESGRRWDENTGANKTR